MRQTLCGLQRNSGWKEPELDGNISAPVGMKTKVVDVIQTHDMHMTWLESHKTDLREQPSPPLVQRRLLRPGCGVAERELPGAPHAGFATIR